MKLTELEPSFLKRNSDTSHSFIDDIKEADGIIFLCPKCFIENKGNVGTHSVICWNPSVPQSTSPTPGRWEMKGNSYNDLELVAGSSSVLLNGGCKAHFFIRNGEVIMC